MNDELRDSLIRDIRMRPWRSRPIDQSCLPILQEATDPLVASLAADPEHAAQLGHASFPAFDFMYEAQSLVHHTGKRETAFRKHRLANLMGAGDGWAIAMAGTNNIVISNFKTRRKRINMQKLPLKKKRSLASWDHAAIALSAAQCTRSHTPCFLHLPPPPCSAVMSIHLLAVHLNVSSAKLCKRPDCQDRKAGDGAADHLQVQRTLLQGEHPTAGILTELS